MSVLWAALVFAFRDVKFRKFVSLLTVLAIAGGLAAFTALRITSIGTKTAAEEVVSSVLAGELLVYGEGLCDLSELVAEDLARIPKVERAVPVVLTMGYVEGSMAFIMGVRPEDLDMAVSEFAEGRGFREGEERVIILEVSFAESRGIEVGDIVLVKPQIGSTSYLYRVVGTADIGMKIQELSAAGTYVIIPLSEAQEMLGREGRISMAMLKLESPEYKDYVKSAVVSMYPGARVFERSDVMKAVYQVISLVDGILLAVTLVGIVVAVFSTSNTIMTNVREHSREIAVMRALGAKTYHIALIFLLEAAFFGLVGGAVGVGLGILGADAVRGLFASTGMLKVPLIIDYNLLGFCLGVSVLVSLGSSLYPIFKACNVKPVEVLKNE